MKVSATVLAALLASTASANAIATPQQQTPQIERVARDDSHASEEHDLWKRKGGGGRGGGGGGGGGRGGSSGSGGSGTGSGGGGFTGPRGGVNGGRTVGGSGPQPNFAGGRFYGGGARQPYKSGGLSPIAGIGAVALVGATAWAFWPGTWYGPRIHTYSYRNEYSFFNASANEQQSKPVMCGCADESVCACDEPEDRNERNEILDELIGNGSYAHLNKSIVDVGEYKGRSTILINGTLPEDTTLADPNADNVDNAAASIQVMLENLGWMPMAAAAMAAALVV